MSDENLHMRDFWLPYIIAFLVALHNCIIPPLETLICLVF